MLVEKVDERLGMLEQQLSDIQTTIAELREMRKLAVGEMEKA